jgi:hypothetical protein
VNGQTELQWDAVQDRDYRVWWSGPDMQWVPSQAELAGHTNRWRLPADATEKLYRLSVQERR